MTLQQSAKAEWRSSWKIVVASMFGLTITGLAPFIMGAFMLPLEAEFGWTRTRISSGLTLALLLGAALMPFAGIAIDRFGPRRIGLPGVISLCGAVALLSLLTQSWFVWIGLWVLVGLAQVLTKSTVWMTGISSAFDRSRGLAIGIGLSGGTIASVLAPIMATYYIGEFGWRTAFICLGATWAVVAVPIIFFWFRTPSDRAAKRGAAKADAGVPGLELREGIRSASYIKILIAAAAIINASMSLIVSMIPLLVSTGFTAMLAAKVAALLGTASVVGRVGTGFLLDRFDARIIGAITFLFPVIACALLLAMPGSIPAAIVAVVFLGLCLGSEHDCTAYLTGRHVGLRRFGTLYGIIGAVMTVGTAIGPLWMSMIYDNTGNYRLGLWICMPLAVLAAGMLLSLDRNPRFGTSAEPAPNRK